MAAVPDTVYTRDKNGHYLAYQVASGSGPDLLFVPTGTFPIDLLWDDPGTFLHEGEVLADAVDRSLRDKANVRGLHPRQLHVFDDPNRDDRGWVLSVAHVDVVRLEQLESRFAGTTRLVPVHTPGRLPYGHGDIIKRAVDHIRMDYLDKPDPDHLLGEQFTLRELRIAHETVAGRALQRDTFRRAMEPHLVATGHTTTGTRGRPAELFRRLGSEATTRRHRS